MTFRQLEYAVEVAEQGSISLAARKLMISQPSLSQSIKNIENEFNIVLFDRSSVPMVPTKAGLVFLNKAHIMLTALSDLKQELSQMETVPRQLQIGISDAGALINKRIFREFQDACPDVKLHLVERDQYLLERMLEAGKLDMIFTMIPYDNPNIRVIPLVEDAFLIALPRSHPVSREWMEKDPDLFRADGTQQHFPNISLGSCRDVQFVLSGRDRLKFAQLSALRTAAEPRIGFETDSLSSAVAIAACPPHGAIVPKMFSMLYDGQDRPCFFHSTDPLPSWGFALSLPKKRPLSQAGFQYAQLFIRYIDSLNLLKPDIDLPTLLNALGA